MDIRKDRDCLVMEAKYHIITDIECKILHYGTEIGVASPGEDSFIMLKKGKHMLSFVSTDNEQDSYKVVFEVPENDIEDYIDVQLAPYRDSRRRREEEERLLAKEGERKREEEQRQKEEFERKKKKELELQRIRDEEIRRNNERIQRYEQEFAALNTYLTHLLENEKLEDINTPQLVTIDSSNNTFIARFARLKTEESSMGLRFTKKVLEWCSEPLSRPRPFAFNRAYVGRRCIDPHGNEVFSIDDSWIGFTPHYFGVSFLLKIADENNGVIPPQNGDIIIRIVDIDGNVLFEHDLETIKTTYEPLFNFPFHINVQPWNDDKEYRGRGEIAFSYKSRHVLTNLYQKQLQPMICVPWNVITIPFYRSNGKIKSNI